MTNLSSIEYDRVLPPLKGVVSYAQDAPDPAPDDATALLRPQVAQGDRRDGRVYFYTDEIELHCNVAVATGRPLIVMGVSGCGKSSLAHSLARAIGCNYYEYVATSESQARDLLYQFDVGRRIADAQVGGADAETLWGNVHQYIEPGPLWWALDPGSASRRGRELESTMPFRAAPNPCLWTPPYGSEPAAGIPAVLLIDEIDKVCARSDARGGDVSREGVQRDLLPLIEGTVVSTKYGTVKTDHILFIASGAFHIAKPSDLLPELQGRLPIRVELRALTEGDFVRILTETDNALTRQYTALMGTEDLTVTFTEEGIAALAKIAADVNTSVENIGARRLYTVMERVFEEVSFDAPDRSGQEITVDADFVEKNLGELTRSTDLSRYVL